MLGHHLPVAGPAEQEIRRVAALAAERAPQADERRKLSQEVAHALCRAGFARHFVPRRHGGAGGSFGALLPALIDVGRGCASAGWCGLIVASSGRIGAYLPEPARHELWREGPDTPLATALAPAGTAVPADGGWRLSGTWDFVSAVDHAEWALLCTPLPGPDSAPEPHFCALPRQDYSIRDTWHTTGMRGTGSNTVVVRDALVPAHRTFPQRRLLTGTGPCAEGDGYDVPLLAAMPPLFAAPVLGAGYAALDAWTQLMRRKNTPGGPIWSSESAQATLVRAAAGLEAARSVLQDCCRTADARPAPNQAGALRNARGAAMAAELVLRTVDDLFRAGGTAAQTRSNPLQRVWRDVHAATQHNVLRFQWSSRQLAERVWENGEPVE
ncbi:hydrolase [Streptomyces misionensis]|uniref:Hydrolase n=1 Tax=Streptomyces misionensis TaxID=67331 RepID=A0A5C6K2W3_9ACTN|nr:acyl-CoA dehydrogenase family protein [Streptomyces misionensis]TWV57412.1 hydrolase [Streptomyces misionensis]